MKSIIDRSIEKYYSLSLSIGTVGSKIIRALEIMRVKKLNLIQLYKINICRIIILSLYIVYKKHEMIKIGNQVREKLQVLSQKLE